MPSCQGRQRVWFTHSHAEPKGNDMRGICPGYGADTGDGVLLGRVRTHAFFLLLHLIFVDVWAQLWPSSSRYHNSCGIDRVSVGHTPDCTAPKSMFFGELRVSQNSACNGLMTALSECRGRSRHPSLYSGHNPLTIASLGRVVAGLSRCGAFRIQQQALHSDSGS